MKFDHISYQHYHDFLSLLTCSKYVILGSLLTREPRDGATASDSPKMHRDIRLPPGSHPLMSGSAYLNRAIAFPQKTVSNFDLGSTELRNGTYNNLSLTSLPHISGEGKKEGRGPLYQWSGTEKLPFKIMEQLNLGRKHSPRYLLSQNKEILCPL